MFTYVLQSRFSGWIIAVGDDYQTIEAIALSMFASGVDVILRTIPFRSDVQHG